MLTEIAAKCILMADCYIEASKIHREICGEPLLSMIVKVDKDTLASIMLHEHPELKPVMGLIGGGFDYKKEVIFVIDRRLS